MSDSRLQRITIAKTALEKAKTIPEAKAIRDQASAIGAYLKEQGYLLSVQNDAAELKLRAERKLGQLIPMEFPRIKKRDANGKATPLSQATTLEESGISRDQSSRWQTVAKIPDEKFEQFVEVTKADGQSELTTAAAIRVAKSGNILVGKFTGDDENYTPPEFLELVRAVLGEIDLDPASNPFAQKTVKAKRYFDEEKNGLAQEWSGRVFLNPPYSNPLIGQFIKKLIEECRSERVPQAILLTNDNTDTEWFQMAGSTCKAFCLRNGRISFYKSDGVTRTSPTNGQTVFFFGKDGARFQKVFAPSGLICRVL